MSGPRSFNVERPMLTLDGCAAITNRANPVLVAAIEKREILYAFDLRAPPQGRRAVRVLTESLYDYVNGLRPDPAQDTPANLRLKVSKLFPALSDTLDAARFARVVCCSSYHVTHLIRARLLKCVRVSGCG